MNKKVIIVILAVVIALAAAGVGAYFLFRDKADAPVVLATYQAGDQIVTNIYTADGSKGALLKVVCVLFYDETYKPEVEKNEIVAFQVRDQVRQSLRGMSMEFVMDVGNEDEMRRIILNELNERMDVEYFHDVMFLDIVIQ